MLQTAQTGFGRAFRRVMGLANVMIAAAFVVGGGICLNSGALAAPTQEKRVALVIGNGAYSSAPALGNPVVDAKAVASALQRLGFDVHSGYDLTADQMRATLADFSTALPDAKAALVYYAGHGVSVDEENYLLPVDIKLKSLTDLDLNTINISLILKQMKREERVNVVILDACRNNPFMDSLSSGRSRSVVSDRGLSRIDSDLAKGSLIAFATDPKSVALDGDPGQNSPFTHALLQHIEDPGVPIDTVMNRVRSQVWTETRNKQMPWVNTSIIGEFFLNPAEAATVTPAATSTQISHSAPVASAASDRQAQDNRLWESAERSDTAEDYRAYLDTYPQGAYAQMARNRIGRLVAVAATPDKPAVDAKAEPEKTASEKPAVDKAASEKIAAKPVRVSKSARLAKVVRSEPVAKATRAVKSKAAPVASRRMMAHGKTRVVARRARGGWVDRDETVEVVSGVETRDNAVAGRVIGGVMGGVALGMFRGGMFHH